MGLWDTLYEGWRCPIYNEMRQAIFDYYRNTYGEVCQILYDTHFSLHQETKQ